MPRSWADDAQQIATAFAYLNTDDPTGPLGHTVQDQRAMTVLRAHPKETKALIIATISKGGKSGRRDPASLLSILPAKEKPEIVQRVVATYAPEDLATPFLGHLAFCGTGKDMERLMKFIAAHPDEIRAVELAKVMVEGNNPHALSALTELKSKIPGKWQQSSELIRFFATSGTEAGHNPNAKVGGGV